MIALEDSFVFVNSISLIFPCNLKIFRVIILLIKYIFAFTKIGKRVFK